MIGSDSEHEFPRCDGHVGRILRNNRCKKNRLVRSVFLLFRYRVGGPDRRKSLFN
ncbi:hypothetical protein AR703_004177 [Salmonella enterica subsp. enterica serovar Cerro]|uniref:Uncharacterized protein n=1 Tax=Salmonella enterica subsp. enterica serovar Heidelberg TaxID=611 RepID=A0A734NJ17_SALET|nr:hypothetical protein [Salmonella enterica subsp. enterica serovar Cerro]EDQ1117629.1 hypothetical protein [Salmonella enterica]EDS5733988.1 hypothetical protein [Salmonella enterica subsp. enterica]EDT3878426.1 hypothetical protein [Salmonella enterica subsp. enterica serovar Rissen]EDT5196455.1 hypothetical protein [Salmonella enterica subsp. enterica serovar Braenderup]EDV0168133.1 hypothetical protein [Salmonella enterica subsp. enterica serovar Saintpaul]EDV4544169.1 hypothetical prote